MKKKDDKHAPATKEDIGLLMEILGGHKEKFYFLGTRMDSQEGTMDSLGETMDALEGRMGSLEQKMDQFKEEIIRHFYVVAENIRHDLLKGALNDKIEVQKDRIANHEIRIGSLEKVTQR